MSRVERGVVSPGSSSSTMSPAQGHLAQGRRDTAASPRSQGVDPWQGWELSPNVQDPALVIQRGIFMLLRGLEGGSLSCHPMEQVQVSWCRYKPLLWDIPWHAGSDRERETWGEQEDALMPLIHVFVPPGMEVAGVAPSVPPP